VENWWQSWNLRNHGSFATCQSRQSAKNPLPPANKGSRQRISVLKKIKKSFATCQSKQLAKNFYPEKNKKHLPHANKGSRQRNSVLKKFKKSLFQLPRGSRQTEFAPSSHDGVHLLCRLPC
jgi:hypothetical protein